ncbi:hypothetical protein KDA_17910 [Dictyobacter alpinus]|uniref:Calcineurin-like phosphoesterase domain-containing protein n=1 Tax=Dictyobacter alpinus TaxID=2014873 RepID=A0A402B4R2_9CHLR|nr:metallophosphoesterase [Dictyobacter alpinus]GCE26307.1 hypothetical protein KDA_17910 [Dictyobacter alpinus]
MSQPIFSFWGLGDFHYRAIKAWNDCHTQRLSALFDDLHELWQADGQPAFCVSPGDLIDTCAPENYELARTSLKAQLGDIPFYPGVGNHEYHGPDGEDPTGMAATFTAMWDKPLRYSWEVEGAVCVMLDYPDPTTLADPQRVYLSQETLTFLDTTLQQYQDRPAIVFLHCPLHNTVLGREGEGKRDYHSLEHFFAPENSAEVRAIIARHQNACLFISGHTHSGWEAPHLVTIEHLGEHPITYVNLMSPWYTGYQKGPVLSDDHQSVRYRADDPDIIPSFSFQIHGDRASIRIRNHATKSWLKEWNVPFHTK